MYHSLGRRYYRATLPALPSMPLSRKRPRLISDPRPASDPDRMIDAAIACFRKNGAAKTSMDDVARAAAVGRQTVYRAFRTRTELLDAVIHRRLTEIAAKIKPILAECSNFEEALTKGSIETMRLARADRIFLMVLEAAADQGVERYLLDPDSPVAQRMLEIWIDTFARARERGELRPDIPDPDLANWLRGVHLILLLREDLTAEGQTHLLRTVVMQGLMPRA